MTNKQNSKPLSIGGWLILPAIGLVLSPFITMFELSGSISEIITIICIIIFYIWLIVQFFRRQYYVPSWMIVFYVLNFLGGIILFVTDPSSEESIKLLFRSILAGAIWIPYFYVSDRVKSTFVYRNSQIIKTPRYFKNIWKKILITSLIFVAIPLILGIIEELFVNNNSATIDNISSSVVNIYCDSSNDTVNGSGGSGTIIDSSGYIITNAHILPQDDEFYHITEEGCLIIIPDPLNGTPKEMYWAMPYVHPSLSEEYDLALLKIYSAYTDDDGDILGDIGSPFPEYVCENYNIRLGDEIRIFGYPEINPDLDYYNLVMTEGIISSITDDFFLTSAKVEQGNSGGIAVDKEGCMIGIPSGIISGTYQNLGTIIPAKKVLEYLESVIQKEEE